MKKILITGVTGFAGSYLAEHLLTKGNGKIYGTTLSHSLNQNISHIFSDIHLTEINLLDNAKVKTMMREIQPDVIFHLAALASPKLSFENPAETITNNTSSQIYLLEAIRNIPSYEPRVLVVSSADVYGIVSKKDLPVNEETPLHPTNPYAVSKIAQDFLGMQYYYAYNIPIIRVRPFNHIGPRQALNFVISDFANKIATIEKGKNAPVITVGNLDAKRDFTDVRDMVRAYDLILENGMPGDVYNIGSGISYSISEILDMLLRLSNKKITIKQDQKLIRPADNPELVCNPGKMQKITGWKPEISIKKTLKDTLDYWRNIV